MTRRISRKFLAQPTLKLAKALLGTVLTTEVKGKRTSGMIVEAEAYHGETDEACHCYRRRTPRNDVMFWSAGHCYVYFIYGMYHCINVVAEQKDIGAAVLIRALEPLEGQEEMQRRRECKRDRDLSNGPGKLCQALAIDASMCGEDLRTSKLVYLQQHTSFSSRQVGTSPRVGISKAADLPWRFYVRGNEWVSKT